jgi:hypothetical protein
VTGCNLPSYRSSVWRIGVKNSCCGGCASADEGQTLPQFGRKNNTDPDDVNSDSIIREKRYFGSILYLSKFFFLVPENLLEFNYHVGQWFLVLNSRFNYFQKFGTLGYTLSCMET